MSKKILITGATGFVGDYLIRQLIQAGETNIYGTYLSEKSTAVLSDLSPKINLLKLDLMDYQDVSRTINKIMPDEIYHLAAITSAKESFDEPAKVLVNNITAQVNILESIRKVDLKPKIMIISSAEVYGQVDPDNLPIDEETPLRPTNPYAVSKLTQDFMGLQYNISYGFKIIRVRPFNHIGPGQSDQFATSAFAKKIAEIEKGIREPLLTVGNLDSKRDFTDVRDMVRAYLLLMQKGKEGDVYNIGSGRDYKMSEVLEMLLFLSKAKISVETDSSLLRPSDNPELICDSTKITDLTGWKPEIPLEKTLEDILKYWREKIST